MIWVDEHGTVRQTARVRRKQERFAPSRSRRLVTTPSSGGLYGDSLSHDSTSRSVVWYRHSISHKPAGEKQQLPRGRLTSNSGSAASRCRTDRQGPDGRTRSAVRELVLTRQEEGPAPLHEEPMHYECGMRRAIGSIAHLERRCSCFVRGVTRAIPRG